MSNPWPINVSDGGHLATAIGSENVGQANYVRKLNFRRIKDHEFRREGWIKFKPNAAGSDNQSVFDGSETLLKQAELVRPNGTRVIVAASLTLIKKFDTSSYTWTTIGSGFSSRGKRWQTETINGYLILNNQVDLPVSYRVEDSAVTPIYELREVGVASVVRIAEYNGFLELLNYVEIEATQLDVWMYPGGYPVTATVTKSANFAPVHGDKGTQFNATTAASAITATLPSPSVAAAGWYIWVKKVDAGAGTVITSPVLTDGVVTLAAINDLAIIWTDGSQYFSRTYAGGVIENAPYGPVPSAITNHIPFAVAWGEFGEPTKWAPLFTVVVPSSSATLSLPFPSHAFIANVTRVAVIGGGPNGGTLGGQSNTPNGVLVTAVSGNQITLEEPTDAGLVYPITVQVTRWSDVSTIAGRQLLQGDGSAIIGAEKIQGQLAIYRDTGIYMQRYTGDATNPFVFKERYAGKNVPKWGDAIASVNGDYHLYPAVGGRFYKFDGINTSPQLHTICDDARDLFFNQVIDTDPCFAFDNPLTKEIWFCNPYRTFAFDYEGGTCAEIDQVFYAACLAKRPLSTDDWIVLGIGKNVYTYGLVNGVTPITTWFRDGAFASASVKCGLVSQQDPGNEKTLINYTPILSSLSPDVEFTVQLYSTYNPNAPTTALLSPIADLPDPQGNNFIPCQFQAIYFQDEITITDTRDIGCMLSSRIFEFQHVQSRGVTRKGVG